MKSERLRAISRVVDAAAITDHIRIHVYVDHDAVGMAQEIGIQAPIVLNVIRI